MPRRLIALVCTLLTLLVMPSAAGADEPPPPDNKGAPAAQAPTVAVKVGIDVAGVSKLDLGSGSFAAEFYLSLRCAGAGECKPGFDIANGKATSKELIVDEPQHKVYRIKADLAGEIDLSEFPFDHHELPIVITEDPKAPTNIKLEIDKEHTSIEKDVKIPGWQLADVETEVSTRKVEGIADGISEATFNMIVRRPVVAATFKNLLPVVFIILVSWSALFLAAKAIANRLALITGGLVSSVMFHVSSTSSLPPIGYLTRADKFLIATYAGLLINVVLAVMIAAYDDAKNEAAVKRLHRIAFGLVPASCLLLWLISLLA